MASTKSLDIQGVVIAQSSKQPQADALVVAAWLDPKERLFAGVAPSAARTDSNGDFKLTMENPGTGILGHDGMARLLVKIDPGGPLSTSTVELIDLSKSTCEVTIEVDDDGQGPGLSDQVLGEIADAIGNLNSSGPSVRGDGDLDDIFNDAVFQVLGQRVRLDQPRDLQMAFSRIFVEKEVDGRSEMTYRGTSGAVAVAGESGNVRSGLQAVAYRDAKTGLTTIRQTLMELEADDDDEQDLFLAERDVVERKLAELVTALGQDVRPPIKRVDGIFELLIGTEYDRAPASLTKLGELVGFAESEALLHELLGTGTGGSAGTTDDITRDDDLVSTRFIEIASYVTGVFLRWEIIKNQLETSGGTVPLGTKLDVLGRLLDRIDEETDNLDAALTRHGIDDAEREFLEIASSPPTSLAELMSWLREFSVDGKSYDSGRGITVVQTTAESIQPLIVDVLDQIDDFPELDKRAIVQALSQLSRTLMQIQAA